MTLKATKEWEQSEHMDIQVDSDRIINWALRNKRGSEFKKSA